MQHQQAASLAGDLHPRSPARDNVGAAGSLEGRKVLIIVENLPVPFDRRVWLEATTLQRAGAQVAVICPKGKGFGADYEELEGIHIYRHTLPDDADSALGYLREYGSALWSEFWLTCKIWWRHGFDVIHACNPPDLIFLVAAPFKLIGKKFIFDHHDINPELYEAKFGRKGFFWHLMCYLERRTFALADVSIATNQSYKQIAVTRGGMRPDDVYVVRSGPDLRRFTSRPADPSLKKGRRYLIGYVGVMGEQEGIDLLLEAVRELVVVRGRRDIQLCLVGGGSSLTKLQGMARDLAVDHCVTFTGRVSDEALAVALSTADICVNPDRVNPMNDKSTMNKIIEYMAMEKPIVQFDVREGRYSAGDASLYAKANDPIDFANKIEQLLADDARRADMGRSGRKRVEDELSWTHQVPTLIAAYRAALRMGNAPALDQPAVRADERGRFAQRP